MKDKTKWFWFILAISFLCYAHLGSKDYLGFKVDKSEAADMREQDITVDISQVSYQDEIPVWVYDTDRFNFTITTDGTTAYDLSGKVAYFSCKQYLSDINYVFLIECDIDDATAGLCHADFTSTMLTTAGLYYAGIRVTESTNVIVSAWIAKLKALGVVDDGGDWTPPTPRTNYPTWTEANAFYAIKAPGHTNTYGIGKDDFGLRDVRVATPTETNQPVTKAYADAIAGATMDTIGQGPLNFRKITVAEYTNYNDAVTKLVGIEDNADVTDSNNVATAGAIMDSDFSVNGLMKRTGLGAYTNITDNSVNWNTAYGWGDHSTAGYADTSDIVEVSTEGLVLSMNFNSEDKIGSAGSETIFDSSTYNNHGLNSGATFGAANGFNNSGAFSFDGTNDYVDCGNIFTSAQTELTISAWIYADTFNYNGVDASTPIISNWNTYDVGNQKGYALEAFYANSTDDIRWRWTVCDGTDSAATPYDELSPAAFIAKYANKWVHIVSVFSGGSYLKIYIDGVLERTKTNNVSANITPNTTSKDWLGKEGRHGGHWNGVIDDVRIYNRALSADEISQLYKQKEEVKNPNISKYVFYSGDGSDQTVYWGLTNRYTKAEADALLAGKADTTGTSSNDFSFGDGADTDKTLSANTGAANPPRLKYNTTSDKWQYSNDGTNYTDIGSGGAGYTNLTQFVEQTANRIFYSDANGDVQELAFGTSNYVYKSQGASAAPIWAAESGGVSGSYSTPIPLSFFATSEAGSGSNNSCQVSFETNANQRVEIRGLSYETNVLQTAYAYTIPFTIGEYPLMADFSSWQTNAFSYTIRTTTTNIADNLINLYLCSGTNQTAMATNIVSTTADTELSGNILTNATINALGDTDSIWWRVEMQSKSTNACYLIELLVNYDK